MVLTQFYLLSLGRNNLTSAEKLLGNQNHNRMPLTPVQKPLHIHLLDVVAQSKTKKSGKKSNQTKSENSSVLLYFPISEPDAVLAGYYQTQSRMELENIRV